MPSELNGIKKIGRISLITPNTVYTAVWYWARRLATNTASVRVLRLTADISATNAALCQAPPSKETSIWNTAATNKYTAAATVVTTPTEMIAALISRLWFLE